MSVQQSITTCLQRLRNGDEGATAHLWCQIRGPLVRTARRDMRGCRKRYADEDDVAQSAFLSLWQGTVGGRFPRLVDSTSLWRLLRVILRRKAIDYRQHECRQKRGGGMVAGESAFHREGAARGLERCADPRPMGETSLEAREPRDQLLQKLNCDLLRQIAQLKSQHYTDQEIADRLACSRATVARKLQLIRKIWQSHEPC